MSAETAPDPRPPAKDSRGPQAAAPRARLPGPGALTTRPAGSARPSLGVALRPPWNICLFPTGEEYWLGGPPASPAPPLLPPLWLGRSSRVPGPPPISIVS